MGDAILDHPVITARYFFPRRTALPDPFLVPVDGAVLHCYQASPHEGAPTVLHFHGNGEVVADWQPHFALALVEAGINVVLAEYRGYGGSSGEPQLATMLDDALAVADAIATPPDQLVVYGRSIGSLYALHIAAHRKIGGLIVESGIADLLPRLTMRLDPAELGVSAKALRAAVREHFDQRAKIEAYAGSLLVIHALDDDLVPPSNAQDFVRWAGDRAELHLLRPGDHNSLHYYHADAMHRLVVDFVRANTS